MTVTSVVTKGDNDSGLNWIIKMLFGTTTEVKPTKWEVGNDATTPSTSDTSCLGRVPYTYSLADACDAVLGWNIGGDAQAIVLNTVDMVEGSGCINIPITDATHTSNWSKTIGAIDLSTGTCDFYLFLYATSTANITSSASAIMITLGTGGFVNSNDYYFTKSALTAAEWSVLRITDPATASNVNGAGATLNNIDRLKLTILTSGSYTGTDLRMDAWHYATEAEHKKDCEASYPVFNYTYQTVTWMTKYTTANAVGYKLQRLAFKNANDKLFNTATYSAVTKSTSKEFRILTLLKFENK